MAFRPLYTEAPADAMSYRYEAGKQRLYAHDDQLTRRVGGRDSRLYRFSIEPHENLIRRVFEARFARVCH